MSDVPCRAGIALKKNSVGQAQELWKWPLAASPIFRPPLCGSQGEQKGGIRPPRTLVSLIALERKKCLKMNLWRLL